MFLIVKDYISQLKEKDELDYLLCDLFLLKGYIADSRPRTGNRQYGVDASMHNRKELLLFVIKQGNIGRDTWNGDKNAIRQSLDEIMDVALSQIPCNEYKKKVKIIVATNGNMDETVKPNWYGYIKSHQVWNNIPLEYEFMGIDTISQEVVKYILNEHLFDSEIQSLLRKALYFIDETDYKKIYFERIIDLLLDKIHKADGNSKKFIKACSSLNLASQMICKYAKNVGNIKAAIQVSEYVIIKYWKLLLENELFEKNLQIQWLIKYRGNYEKWSLEYLRIIEKVVAGDIILPKYNVIENRVLLYEILGYLVSFGNYLLDCTVKSDYHDIAKRVINAIIEIINKYPYYIYTPYDVNINVMIMLYRILYYYKRQEEIISIIQYHTDSLIAQYKTYRKYPAPSDTFEEALAIENSTSGIKYEVSALWGYYLLVIYFFDQKEIYDQIKSFLLTELKEVSKCVWFLRRNEELLFYEPYAMNKAGEGIDIPVEDEYELFRKKIMFLMEQYENEVFSYQEYEFKGLEFLVCHYYNYIPKICFTDKEKDQ